MNKNNHGEHGIFWIVISILFVLVLSMNLAGLSRAKISAVNEARKSDTQKEPVSQPTQKPTETPAIIPEIVKELVKPEPLPEKVLHDAPFVAQAPFGNWNDAKQNYGCEEASLLMAVHWFNGKELTKEYALREILAMSDFELGRFGDFHDTSLVDTLDLLKEYLKHDNAYVKFDINRDDIKKELAAGNLVVVPIDGRKVGNIYYTPPGPYQHQILVVGYDDATQEFITHDPGTARGAFYRYGYKVLENALMDYPTGNNEIVTEIRSGMIVIGR